LIVPARLKTETALAPAGLPLAPMPPVAVEPVAATLLSTWSLPSLMKMAGPAAAPPPPPEKLPFPPEIVPSDPPLPPASTTPPPPPAPGPPLAP